MKRFNTVAQMKLAKLTAGQTVTSQGYHAAGDGGEATYLVVTAQAVDGYGDHTLGNGNVALLQQIEGKRKAIQYGVIGDGTTDDSAAVQAAIDSLATYGGELSFGSGKFLVSDVTVEDVTVVGVGVGANDAPYDNDGTTFIITDTVDPAFNIKRGASFIGCNFYYPNQDGSTVTPITYPALMEFDVTSTVTNFTLDNCVLVNPFNGLNIKANVAGGIAHGRIYILNTQVYAVNNFITADDVLDDIHVVNFVCSPGVYQDVALTGNAYLRKWTQANGTAFLFEGDVDGFSADMGIVFGYSQAFASSGDIDLINFNQISIDQCPVAWNKTAGEVRNMVWANCDVFAVDVDQPSLNVAAFNFNGAGKTEALFTGITIAQTMGAVLTLADGGVSNVRFSDSLIKNWATATGLSGNRSAFACSGSSHKLRLDNIEAYTAYSEATFVEGFLFNEVSIRGCDMDSLDKPIVLSTGNTAILTGNTTSNTGTSAVSIGTVGRLINKDNNYDIPGHLTANKGIATIPSGTTTIDIPHGLSIVPVAQDISVTQVSGVTNAPIDLFIQNSSPTTLTINCGADPGASGITFVWQVTD